MSRVSALIVAAGAGERFGGRKQFALLRGRPVVDWALEAFQAHEEVDDILLVLPDEGDRERYRARYGKIAGLVRGGQRRQDSAWLGFQAVDTARTAIVLVHDGVRPLVSRGLISRVVAAARANGAAVPAIALEDTVKESREGRVLGTIDRSALVRVQTPQGFRPALLRRGLEAARHDGFYGTDEAALLERLGIPVSVVEGDPRNIKITTAVDLRIAEALLDA